jgi:hypothetical protein
MINMTFRFAAYSWFPAVALCTSAALWLSEPAAAAPSPPSPIATAAVPGGVLGNPRRLPEPIRNRTNTQTTSPG